MTDAADESLTRDALLNGRVMLRQPRSGYRAATDPVLLAAFCPAEPGESVLDLGCGAGAAALCLGARVAGLSLTGLEIQPEYAALARRNAVENGMEMAVHEGDLTAPPRAIRDRSFDHVLANPPYFEATGAASPDPGRDRARRAPAADVAAWVDSGLRRLLQGGWLTIIHRVERAPDIMAALAGRAGSITLAPLVSRVGREAGRVLIRAKKDSRTPFRLGWPLTLHEGAAHLGDRDDFTEEARAILRDGLPLRR